eukprot:15337901-Ditylum_brightwellii.AAC.2
MVIQKRYDRDRTCTTRDAAGPPNRHQHPKIRWNVSRTTDTSNVISTRRVQWSPTAKPKGGKRGIWGTSSAVNQIQEI